MAGVATQRYNEGTTAFDTTFERTQTMATRDEPNDYIDHQNLFIDGQQSWISQPCLAENNQTCQEISNDPLSDLVFAREAQSCDPLIEQPKERKTAK